jgi:hypothetical protein
MKIHHGFVEWRKSSFSMSNGDCIEVACLADGTIGVRDSKMAEGPILSFAPQVWSTFLDDVRRRGLPPS